MNAIKDSIKSGRTVVGTTAGPNVDVSILADAGYDFVLFDTQHSAWEIKQLQPSIQAIRGKQAAPLVRVAANQAYQICFALDAGARGIVVPMVNTSAEAEAAVRACRYFPLGNRSNAGVRGEWGEFKNYRDYLDTVNNELVIVPMIETNQSLENLDAIASVPGVDVVLIGPSDLSIELGVPLDYSCDTYQRALDKIAAAAAKRGIAAGMYFIPPEMDPNFFVQKGFKFFTMPWGPWAKAGIQTEIGDVSAHRGRRADLADIEDRLVPIWHAKPARTMQVLPLGLELTVSIEDLDAVVLAVSNIDPAIGVTADVVNDVEFAFAGAGLTPRQHTLSVGRVFVDPRIAVPVRDIDIALGRQRRVRTAMKRLAAHIGRRLARHAELQQDFAVERDLAHKMSTVVGEEHRIVRCYVDAVRTRVLALTPRSQEVAFAVEHHHRMVSATEDIDIVVAVDPDPADLLELPAIRQLRPVGIDLISIVAASHDHRHIPSGDRFSF